MKDRSLVLLGVGTVGWAVATLLKEKAKIIGTTRQPGKLLAFVENGLDPIVMPWPAAEVIEPLTPGAEVLVTFPPDGTTDAILAPGCASARSIIYVSSTGVYGDHRGQVNDDTEPAPDNESAKLRLEAESIWRAIGATVLRAPAIYGPETGLHVRLRNNNFAIPGDGSGLVSRIHVEDLARIIDTVFQQGIRSETFVVGDLKPSSHREVVEWLCANYNFPMPPYAPLDQATPHLRSSRSVDSSRVLKTLGLELKYPTYKEGFASFLP